jgi:hypothetical protein
MTFSNEVEWEKSFKKAIANVGDGMNYEEAATTLCTLVEKNLLSLTDIQDNPKKFFKAHR